MDVFNSYIQFVIGIYSSLPLVLCFGLAVGATAIVVKILLELL